MILLFALLLSGSNVHAHANLKVGGYLPPRNDNPGLKVAPCGNIPRTLTPKVIVMGSTVTVEWQETINHPGRFEFYYSLANDANWVLLKTVADNQDTAIVNGLYHQYSTTVTFPAGVTCTDCTFQMIQVMTENPASPSYYYSCADIRLQAAATTPVPTPVPAPVPAPVGNSCPP